MSQPATSSAGIDAGSTTVKLAGLGADGDLLWQLVEPTEPKLGKQVADLIERAGQLAGTSLANIPVVATGYGRNLVPGNRRKVTEITCHARGAWSEFGHGGTLVDIGGQDSKVIVIDSSGAVKNFVMNDKCAAGTGRFLEVAAARLRIDLDEMGKVALATGGEVSISSTCTVFAESEIVSLIARGHPVDEIVRGLTRSLVRRVSALARSAGLAPPVMLSGGVANNPAVGEFLGEELECKVALPAEPQLTGAIGAALIALDGHKAS